jgi:drug/metabolite transporter (DMT)-like permease
MNDNRWLEYVILVALVGVALVLLDPMHWWMPSMVQMAALAGLVAVFAVLAAILVRDSARDEREQQLRSSSGRVGFLVGAGVLVIAIVWQGFLDMLDPWLVYALVAMVCGKIVARVYAEQA